MCALELENVGMLWRCVLKLHCCKSSTVLVLPADWVVPVGRRFMKPFELPPSRLVQ